MKKVMRLMAVAIIALSGLCACNNDEPPYRDNPEEVAAKTAMIENVFKTLRDQPWAANADLKVTVSIKSGTTEAINPTFLLSEVRISGDLIYFGDSLVLHVVQLLRVGYQVDTIFEGHPINRGILFFVLP